MKFSVTKSIFLMFAFLLTISMTSTMHSAEATEIVDSFLSYSPVASIEIGTAAFDMKIVSRIMHIENRRVIDSTINIENLEAAFVKLGTLILFQSSTRNSDLSPMAGLSYEKKIEIGRYIVLEVPLSPLDVAGISSQEFEVLKSHLSGKHFKLSALRKEEQVNLRLEIMADDEDSVIFDETVISRTFANALSVMIRKLEG